MLDRNLQIICLYQPATLVLVCLQGWAMNCQHTHQYWCSRLGGVLCSDHNNLTSCMLCTALNAGVENGHHV